jgi:hypothetical protein
MAILANTFDQVFECFFVQIEQNIFILCFSPVLAHVRFLFVFEPHVCHIVDVLFSNSVIRLPDEGGRIRRALRIVARATASDAIIRRMTEFRVYSVDRGSQIFTIETSFGHHIKHYVICEIV